MSRRIGTCLLRRSDLFQLVCGELSICREMNHSDSLRVIAATTPQRLPQIYIRDYFSKGRQEELQCILTALCTLNQHTNHYRTPSRIFHQLKNAKIPLDLLYVN
jgi:hypothetical protein